MAEQLAFERLIADLVQSLVSAPTDQLDAGIRDGLLRLASHLGVEGIAFGQLAADGALLATHQAHVERARESPSTRSTLRIPLAAVEGVVWGAIELVGPARSRRWSADQIQRLGLLGRLMMEAVRRRESEREERHTCQTLAAQVAFEDLLTQLSAAFVAVPSPGVDDEIDRWLRALAEFLDMDRCALLQQSSAEAVLHMTHFHAGPQAPPMPTVVSRDEFPWYMAKVSRGEMIRMEQLPEWLPREAEHERVHATRTRLGALLVLPFSFGDVPLGALAFASATPRPWPDALVGRLQLVAQVFAGALGRRQARRGLEERLEFERLITEVVRAFVSVTGDQLDAEIRRGLALLISHFGVDRATLTRLSDDGTRLIVTHTARTKGIPPPNPTSQHFPWYLEQLKTGRIVQLSRYAEDLPPTAAGERQHGLETGLRSHLAIPLIGNDGHVWGSIGFSSFGSPRHWTDDQAQRLRLVGEIMMEAVNRYEAAEAARRQRDELAHMARVAALGELTSALAHELNQPLATIHTNAQATRRRLAAGGAPGDLDEVFGDIATAAARAADLIRRLRNLLRRRQLEKIPLDVNEMLRDVRPLLVTEARRHRCRVTCHLAEVLPKVAGDVVQLQQVVLNLARNAAEATASGSAGEVVVRTADVGDGHVTVSVEDSGPAIDDAALASMFTPFHTTKPEGLGIGLAISRSIVEAHGGRLWAERRGEGGLVVRFTVPAARDGRA